MRWCCLRYQRSYTHEVPPAWLPKHELNKDKETRKCGRGKLTRTQAKTKNYWQLRKAENEGIVFSELGAQLVIQCQMVSSENTSIQVTLYKRSVFVKYLEKMRPWVWKRTRWEGNLEGFGGSEGKRKKDVLIIYNLNKWKYYFKGEVIFQKREITGMILTRGRF